MANTILNNTVEDWLLLNFKVNYKDIVIQEGMVLVKECQIDQWERIKIPEINSHKHSQLIFDKYKGRIIEQR